MNNKKIVFILGIISQPRCIKRINSFINNGFEVEIYGFDRGIYNSNININNKTIHIIGKQEDGKKYFSKFFQINKAIKNIIKKEGKNNTVYYSFGFLHSLFLMIYGCKHFIYEISDILYGYKKFNLLRPLLKATDRLLIKKSILTIYTSGGFDKYLSSTYSNINTIIQPNRLDTSFREIERPVSCNFNLNELNFSFIGAFRYPNTIFRFAKIIGQKYPNHKFHFFGDSSLRNDVIKLADKYDNVLYHGAFKNPDDLTTIYNKIDIVVAAYDTSGLNERIAEPNKLYEALFFRKPIIVSIGTYLENKVNEYDCGYSIDSSEDDKIIEFIESITSFRLIDIQKSIDKVELDEIIDDNASAIIKYIMQYKI